LLKILWYILILNIFKEPTPKSKKKKKRELQEEPVEDEPTVGMYNILLSLI